MQMLLDLVASGRITEIALAVLVLEAVLLTVVRRRLGRGIPLSGIVTNFLAGAFLLLALRSALTDAGPMPIAVFLAGALVAHVADVAIRWRNG